MLGIPKMEPDCLSTQRFLAILLFLGSRRLRPRPARTAADLVFVLAPKVTQNGAGLLINTTFSLYFTYSWGPGGPGPAHIVMSARKTFRNQKSFFKSKEFLLLQNVSINPA